MSTMKNIVLVIFGGLSLFSCIKHEVIPPPRPEVELNASFRADTNGFPIIYSKGVSGFDIKTSDIREILTPPQFSNIKYFSSIESVNLVEYFKVSIGRDFWSAASGNYPPIGQFKIYFENLMASMSVAFSDDATTGVALEWRDANNQLWRSREEAVTPQIFSFTSVSQESDESGDYLKFRATFTATLYSLDESESRFLQNGEFVAYFKNN